jgi:transcriptional regulator with XRE-family HTH domain
MRKNTTPLNEAIKNSKMKLQSILDDAGMEYARLYQLRHGTSKPKLAEANALALVLQKTTEELFPNRANTND